MGKGGEATLKGSFGGVRALVKERRSSQTQRRVVELEQVSNT